MPAISATPQVGTSSGESRMPDRPSTPASIGETFERIPNPVSELVGRFIKVAAKMPVNSKVDKYGFIIGLPGTSVSYPGDRFVVQIEVIGTSPANIPRALYHFLSEREIVNYHRQPFSTIASILRRAQDDIQSVAGEKYALTLWLTASVREPAREVEYAPLAIGKPKFRPAPPPDWRVDLSRFYSRE